MIDELDEENWLSQPTTDEENTEDLDTKPFEGPCILNGYIKKDCPMLTEGYRCRSSK